MIDNDLAKLYQCKNGTKEINQAVARNKEKFLERYSWKLAKEEIETHAGSKTFSINILEDTIVKDSLIKKMISITE